MDRYLFHKKGPFGRPYRRPGYYWVIAAVILVPAALFLLWELTR